MSHQPFDLRMMTSNRSGDTNDWLKRGARGSVAPLSEQCAEASYCLVHKPHTNSCEGATGMHRLDNPVQFWREKPLAGIARDSTGMTDSHEQEE
jgi:hypothetical protein